MNGHSAVPPVDLGRALGVQRLATRVVMELAVRIEEVMELAVLIEEHLPPRAELLAVVADDVVARWLAFDGVGRRPVLFGPAGFIATYVDTVERDGQGRAHRWFGPSTDRVSGQLVCGVDYRARVWAHHAGWLARIAAPAAAPPLGEDLTQGRLRRELGVEWLRIRVAAELAPLVWASLEGDRARIASIVDDVVSAWLARGPEDRRELTGCGGFVDGYYSRVYFATEDDGEEVRWPQFCPPEGEAVDEVAYARTVWRHHLATLAGAR